MEQENQNQLIHFAVLAEKQGYEAAKKVIMESKDAGLDKNFALHIAYLSEKYGQVIGQDAIYFPEKYDKRSESEKIADQITGSSEHLNPDFGKETKLYRVGGLEEVPGTNGIAWRMPKPNKEECSNIAAMINQGTADIINNPGMEARKAIGKEQFLRDFQARSENK